MSACSSDKTTLETGPRSIPSVVNADPCSAPDRSRILFHRTMPGSEPIWHVFSVNADGTCRAQLTKGKTHVLNWGASWSPDGGRIAFIRKDAGVMVADWNGEHERLVLAETKVQPSGAHTDWSPDGTRLVAERQDGVWVIDVASGAAKHVGRGGSPSWSPDGKRIAFNAIDDPAGAGYPVVTVEPDGSDRRVVCDCGVGPDWGANNRIALADTTGIKTIKPDGSDEQPVPGSKNTGSPRWNRDATRIVGSIGPGGMKVFDPHEGFLFVVDTGAGADAHGGSDFDDDW